MEPLFYNGHRLRNDAKELALRIGVDRLPQYYDFGVYAGWTRGEVKTWRHFADLIESTEGFLASQGLKGPGPHFTPHPAQVVSRSLFYVIGSNHLEVKDNAAAEALLADWDVWSQSFQEMLARQPMFRLYDLVSEYCRNTEAGWSTDWFYGFEGQCKLLDWTEGGCGDPLPFAEMNPVVTPAFRHELSAIRARRVGWLLDLGNSEEYHLVYGDEEMVADFRRRHCAST